MFVVVLLVVLLVVPGAARPPPLRPHVVAFVLLDVVVLGVVVLVVHPHQTLAEKESRFFCRARFVVVAVLDLVVVVGVLQKLVESEWSLIAGRGFFRPGFVTGGLGGMI